MANEYGGFFRPVPLIPRSPRLAWIYGAVVPAYGPCRHHPLLQMRFEIDGGDDADADGGIGNVISTLLGEGKRYNR